MILKLEFDKRTLEHTHTHKYTPAVQKDLLFHTVFVNWEPVVKDELSQHYHYRNIILHVKIAHFIPLPNSR